MGARDVLAEKDFLPFQRLPGFQDPEIVGANEGGLFGRKQLQVRPAYHPLAGYAIHALKPPVGREITALGVFEKDRQRTVVHDRLQPRLALPQSIFLAVA